VKQSYLNIFFTLLFQNDFTIINFHHRAVTQIFKSFQYYWFTFTVYLRTYSFSVTITSVWFFFVLGGWVFFGFSFKPHQVPKKVLKHTYLFVKERIIVADDKFKSVLSLRAADQNLEELVLFHFTTIFDLCFFYPPRAENFWCIM